MFEITRLGENDSTYAQLLEKNIILNEKVKGIKREHEIQLVRLCEVTKKKKKVEEDKRKKENRLEERISIVQNLTNTQLDMMNQLVLSNQELNRKHVEIENMIS